MILFWKVLLVYSIRGCDVKFERFKNGTIRIYSKNWNEDNSANSSGLTFSRYFLKKYNTEELFYDATFSEGFSFSQLILTRRL